MQNKIVSTESARLEQATFLTFVLLHTLSMNFQMHLHVITSGL